MPALSTASRLRALSSLFAVCALTACVGDDDTNPNTTASATASGAPSPAPAVPAPAPAPAVASSLTVNSSTTAVATGTHTLDTTTKAYAYTIDILGGKMQIVSPSAATFDVTFRYMAGDQTKYIIGVDSSSGFHGCRSAAWTAEDVATLSDGGDDIAICTGTVTIDSATRHIVIAGATLPLMKNATKSINVNADITWTPLAIAPTITVESGSTNLSVGTDELTSGESGSDTYGGMVLGVNLEKTSRIGLSLAYPEGHPEKYLVAAQNTDNSSNFGCVSSAWTSAEREQLRVALNTAALQTCPSSVSYDAATRLLTLSKTSLPSLSDDNNPDTPPLTLVLSMSQYWHAPSFPVEAVAASPAGPAPAAVAP